MPLNRMFATGMQQGKNWIAGATKNKGALHKALHIKSGKNIPASKLEIKKGDSALMKKRKTLAKTLKGFHK